MSELDTLAKAGIQAINDKEYDKAIESFLQALELEPDRPDINNALGMAYLHRGDAGNAIPHNRSPAAANIQWPSGIGTDKFNLGALACPAIKLIQILPGSDNGFDLFP